MKAFQPKLEEAEEDFGFFPELDFYRAHGQTICTVCKKTYQRHDAYLLFPSLTILCNGDLVHL